MTLCQEPAPQYAIGYTVPTGKIVLLQGAIHQDLSKAQKDRGLLQAGAGMRYQLFEVREIKDA